MKENIDRELPVVTGLGTFIGSDISRMAHLDTPLGRGIQFGVGEGKMPISNFPGDQTGLRPLWGKEKMPRISVDELLNSLSKNVSGGDEGRSTGRIDRVTIKVERETDQKALLDVVQGIREKLSRAEIVVASHRLSVLGRVKEGDVNPDVLQQLLVDRPTDVLTAGDIAYALNGRQIFENAEVVFPIPNVNSPSADIEEISQLLAGHGHDSYIDLVGTQEQVGACLSASSMFNFGQRCRVEGRFKEPKDTYKLRGFYVTGVPDGLNLSKSDANFASLGKWLWADKKIKAN